MAENKILAALMNAPYVARYGVGAVEKEKFALTGKAPGFKRKGGPRNKREIDLANRSASVFLGGKKWDPATAQGFNHIREGINFALGRGYDKGMIAAGNRAANAAYADKIGAKKKLEHQDTARRFLMSQVQGEVDKKTEIPDVGDY